MEKQKCTNCVNGFIMTGFGPKPCPKCGGKGYIFVDDSYNDDDSYSTDSQSNYSSSDTDDDTNDYGSEKNKGPLKIRPFGCILTIGIFAILWKVLLFSDWSQFGPYAFVGFLIFVGIKLSVK